jgi:CO/xanthine dehydrogenase Mo-binding subunit
MEEKRSKVMIDEVFAAADALTAAGERPSVRAVHARVGGGSLGTIQKYLNQWAAARKESMKTEAALSVEIQRAILVEIERRAAEARSGVEADLLSAKKDRDALSEESEAQAVRIRELEKRIEALGEQLQQNRGVISQKDLEIEGARERESKAREEAKLEIEKSGLKAQREIEELRAEAERYRLEAQELRTMLVKAELRLETLPRFEEELQSARIEFKSECEKRYAAEQAAAVLSEKSQSQLERIEEGRLREDQMSRRIQELEGHLLKDLTNAAKK